MLFLSLIIICLIIVIWLLYHRSTFWSRQGIRGPNLIEFIGGFFVPFHEHGLKMFEKYGPIYGVYGLTNKSLVISDPHLIREVFEKRFHEFPDRVHWCFNNYYFERMLVIMRGDSTWKRIRCVLSPAFTSKKLKAMISVTMDISDKLVQNLESKSGSISIENYIKSFSMDVICACAYGINPDSLNNPDHPFIVNVKKLTRKNISVSTVVSVIAPKIASFFNLEAFDLSGISYFADQTEKILIQYKDNKLQNGTNLIQLMIESNNKFIDSSESHSNYLTTDEMTAQAIMLFIVGSDTTSSALSHAIYYLAQNNDCQQRIYEELKSVKVFSYDTLTELKYLNAFIYECLRLAPPVVQSPRVCAKDTEINGIKIPAGTSIDISPYVVHRDAKYWQDPLTFNPERFIEPTHYPWAYIPFGGGPRMCIAERFALNEIRICCAKLINNFVFSPAPGFNLEYFTWNIVLEAKQMRVVIKKRE